MVSDTFPNNPQYRITLTDADPDDDDTLCTCVLAVLQKYRRQLRHAGLDLLAIGFAVYQVIKGSNTRNSGWNEPYKYFSENGRCFNSAFTLL